MSHADATGQPLPEMERQQSEVVYPRGYKPGLFLTVMLDEQGKPYTNAPGQIHLALHLARMAMNYAAERATIELQKQHQAQSPIVTAPAHLAKGLIRPA